MIDQTKYTTALTDLLQQALVDRGFVDTGDLYDSIEFIFNQTTYSIELELGALEYIKYLDGGDFINNFFESQEVDNTIKEMVTEYITSKIKEL